MNYQSLIYFKTVADHLHYTKAAEDLFISQPALSKAIANLEIDLGVALFKKNGRNIALTECGQEFYDNIKISLQYMDKALLSVENYKNSIKNIISISAINSMYANFLPETIMFFKNIHPNVHFDLQFKSTSLVLNDLLANNCDFGICSDFSDTNYNFEKILIREEPLAIITSKNHRLASRKSITVDELQNEKFIVYIKSDFGTNKVLNNMCSTFNFKPNITTEASNDHTLLALVSTGEGISIISKNSGISLEHVAVIDIDYSPTPTRNIYLVWKKDKQLTKISKDFINLIHKK